MRQLWEVVLSVQTFISDSRDILWREINPELLEEESKGQMKLVKGLGKLTRWCDAYKKVDYDCKNFLNTVPLIQGACVRVRGCAGVCARMCVRERESARVASLI